MSDKNKIAQGQGNSETVEEQNGNDSSQHAAKNDNLSDRLKRNYYIQNAITSILRISLEPISLKEQLERILDLILSIPWLALQSTGSIFLVEDEPDVLVMKAQRGMSASLRKKCLTIPFGKCLCGRAASSKKMVFSESVDQCHEIIYEGMMPHGHYCVPIMSTDKLLGVINVYVKEGHKIDQLEVDFLTAVANTLVSIIERKQSDEKLRRNYYIQSAISSILCISLEHISLEEQLERILDLILSIPWLSLQSKGAIFLVEDDPDVLHLKAQCRFSHALRQSCSKVPFGQCLCGLAASSGQTVFSNHVDHRHTIRYEGMMPHGHYNIPIKSEGNVLGIICMYIKEGHGRDKGEEEFLTTVANTIAGIIKYKKAEEEKQVLQKKLLEAEKHSALGRLTANVAHEIRNPLTILGGFAKRLYKKAPLGTEEKEYAAVILNETARLERILRNVITYCRRTPIRPEKYDLNKIVNESLKAFEFTCKEKAINIEKSSAYLDTLHIDRDKAREAIDNIISNALDSMLLEGTLKITTKREFLNEISYATVSVSDTGQGISEERLNEIFEPFYSTKAVNSSHATGMGLSISKKIMEEHGGFIRLESRLGHGSSFSLYFPYRN